MGSAATGSIGVAFEPTATPGERLGFILSYGNVAATASATNQPTGSSGMRLHVLVYDNTATGTVGLAGKDINGNALTETIPPTGSIPIFNVSDPTASKEQRRYEYW